MDTLNLNKKILLVFSLSFFLVSCTDDKDKNCNYLELKPFIDIYDFQEDDPIIESAYLLVFKSNSFKRRIDSIKPRYISNKYKTDKYAPVEIGFDIIELNTEHNYILVTNQETKYMISDYTFKQFSRKMMFKTKILCEVDSIKVNSSYINEIGGTLKLSKNFGIPLK